MSDQLKPYAQHYLTLKGPGDSRPTALQVLQDNDLVGQLKGKTALITGGTSGLGIEVARALLATGADVFITARDLEKTKTVVHALAKSQGGGKLEVVEMDMDSIGSVKKAAKDFLSRSSRLNILINNAGMH